MGSRLRVSAAARMIQVAIDDWRVDTAVASTLIVNRADATWTTSHCKDLRSGRTRMAARRPLKGSNLTAHVLIREHATKPHAPALMLMTAGSSLPVAKVASGLSRLFPKALEVPKHEPHFFARSSGAKGVKPPAAIQNSWSTPSKRAALATF